MRIAPFRLRTTETFLQIIQHIGAPDAGFVLQVGVDFLVAHVVGFFQAGDDGAQVVFAGRVDGFRLVGGMGEGEDGMAIFVAQVEQVAVPPGGVDDEGALFDGFPEVDDEVPVEVVFLPDDVDELPGGD